MKTSIILLLIVFISLTAFGQHINSYQLQGFVGKNMTHSSLHTEAESNYYGISLDFNRKTTGVKYWQYAHHYPQMGLQFTAISLGNRQVYGYAFLLVPYLEFNIWKTKFGYLQIKHGTGLAYATKRYKSVKNPENQILSLNINATTLVDVGYRIFAGKQLDFKAGAIFHHISNGGIQIPNFGFNTLSGYSSISYFPKGRIAPRISQIPEKVMDKFVYRAGTALGFYHYNSSTGKINITPVLSFLVFHQHNLRFRTGLGIELGKPVGMDIQPSLYAEEEVQFTHLVTRYGFGGYLANSQKGSEAFYSKIGIAYYPKAQNHIPKGWFIGALLKSHIFIAAHVEVSTGYTF